MNFQILRLLHSIGFSNLSDKQIEAYKNMTYSDDVRKPPMSFMSPLIPLTRIENIDGLEVMAKVDALNPSNSVKFNMVKYIVENAEKNGILKEGGVLIDTIGDHETGINIAKLAIQKNYQFICAVSSKNSPTAIDLLRFLGAKVYVCPAHVSTDDPRSYYEVAKRLHSETKNSIYLNFSFNELNPEAHYKLTGPEIWNQTKGEITHFITSMRTGGTISGVGKFLKEMNPRIQIIGVDAYGSVLKKYIETGEFDPDEIYPYRINIGNNLIPGSLNPSIIDRLIKVADMEAALTTRELALKEGLFVGYISGATYQAFKQISGSLPVGSKIVMYFPDNGYNDIDKVFSDRWMENQGFFDNVTKESKKPIYVK